MASESPSEPLTQRAALSFSIKNKQKSNTPNREIRLIFQGEAFSSASPCATVRSGEKSFKGKHPKLNSTTARRRAEERGIRKGERIAKNSAYSLNLNQRLPPLSFAAPLSLARRSFGYFPSLLKESNIPTSVTSLSKKSNAQHLLLSLRRWKKSLRSRALRGINPIIMPIHNRLKRTFLPRRRMTANSVKQLPARYLVRKSKSRALANRALTASRVLQVRTHSGKRHINLLPRLPRYKKQKQN